MAGVHVLGGLSGSIPRVLVDKLVRLTSNDEAIVLVVGHNRLASLLSLLITIVQSERGWHRLRGHHLHENLLRILQSLE